MFCPNCGRLTHSYTSARDHDERDDAVAGPSWDWPWIGLNPIADSEIRSLDSFTVPEAGPSLRYLREKEHRERAGARRVAAVDQLVRARIWSAVEAGRPTMLVRQIVSHSVDGSPADGRIPRRGVMASRLGQKPGRGGHLESAIRQRTPGIGRTAVNSNERRYLTRPPSAGCSHFPSSFCSKIFAATP